MNQAYSLPLQPNDLVADRFQIEALAGEGGMGAVFRARDLKKNQLVALKTFRHKNPSEEESFFREAQLLSELEHPSVVQYISHGRSPKGFVYLVMEWLEGEDLGERLRNGGLTLPETMQVVRQAAEVLQAVHEQGIIHRDIKPPNLFLMHGRCEQIKLIDFGIAKLHQAKPTQTNALIGTLGYMAPEQARGNTLLDPRADIFSLGCVFFECLAGQPPFTGEHEVSVLAKILLEEAPRLRDLRPSIPRALDELIVRMLSKDPAQRPGSAAEVSAALPSLAELTRSQPKESSASAEALTQKEQRLLCIVLLAPALASPPPEETLDATLPGSASEDLSSNRNPLQPGNLADEFYRLEEARYLVEQHGGRFEQLANGSRVAALWGIGAASDQASRGARCALSLRKLFPQTPIALAMGRHVADTRLPLGEVIEQAARLLQKSASDVGQVLLNDLAAGLLEGSFALDRSEGGARLSRELQASSARTLFGKVTPFVGRDQELTSLLRSAGESLRGRKARATLLLAPLGAGKSRLAHEVRSKLKVLYPQALLWTAKGDLISGGSPYRLLRQLLIQASGLSLEPSDAARKAWRAWLQRDAQLTEEDVAFLGELLELSFPEGESLPLQAARQDPLLMTEQLKRAFLLWLQQRCEKRPLFLLLDDLHWADAPSLTLIGAALAALSARPLWVLAFARPELKATSPNLWAERGVTELPLAPLSPEACTAFVQRMLPDTLQPEQVARLVLQAEGNAFYLEELLRAASTNQESLPQTLLAVIQARLEQLPEEARRCLRAGSVIGLSFSQSAVEALLSDANTAALGDTLRWLCQQEILFQPKTAGDPDFSFRHSLLREASYQMLTAQDQRLGHRLAARWLLTQHERDAFVLAEHFLLGQETAQALRWYVKAAEQALDGGDLGRVFAICRKAKLLGATGEEAGLLSALAAGAYNWRASFPEAQDAAQEALGLLPPASAYWFQAAAELVLASGRLNNQQRLVSTAKLLLVHDAASNDARCMLAMTRAVPRLLQSGELRLGSDLLERLSLASRDLSSRDFAFAWVPVAEASAAMLRGDLGLFLAHMQEAVRRFTARGDRSNACLQRLDVGYAYYFSGDYPRATAELREVSAEADALGLYRITTAIQRALATSLLYTGHIQEGLALLRKTLQQTPDERTRLHLLSGLLWAGALEVAALELDTLLSSMAPDSAFAAQAHACHAELLLRRGDPTRSLEVAAHAMNLRKGLAVEVGDTAVRLSYAQALLANQRTADALRTLEEAHNNILQRAQQISDPHLRATFLDNIPEHVAVASLLAQWRQHEA